MWLWSKWFKPRLPRWNIFQIDPPQINLLFAAKEIAFPYYQKLMHVVPDSTYVQKLAGMSENVLELVNASYTKVVRNVKFTTNISDHVRVTFQSTCNKKEFKTLMNFTNTCDNIEIGSVYTFLVTLELTRLPRQDVSVKRRLKLIVETRIRSLNEHYFRKTLLWLKN